MALISMNFRATYEVIWYYRSLLNRYEHIRYRKNGFNRSGKAGIILFSGLNATPFDRCVTLYSKLVSRSSINELFSFRFFFPLLFLFDKNKRIKIKKKKEKDKERRKKHLRNYDESIEIKAILL